MKKFKMLIPILNLFDGGAAAGGDGAAAAAEGAASGDTNGTPVNTRRGKSGESKVLYGKQPSAAAQTDADTDSPAVAAQAESSVTSNTLEEKRKAYRALVEGEYKDIYTEDTQRIINRRFNDTESLRTKVNESQPIIDMLLQRYNIQDGSMRKLTEALENDSAYWSEAAEAAGMEVEQYKQFQKLERENAELRKMQARQHDEAARNQQMQTWMAQADEVKATYPSFDLAVEVNDQSFLRMLQSGVDMKHAYEVCHMEDIKAGIAQAQAKATEKQVVAGIRAKGVRPAENGTAAQSGFTVKDDVSKLSKQDRAEIVRRIARGERIEF